MVFILRNRLCAILSKVYKNAALVSQRNIQMSLIGCTNEVGTNLALLLKKCTKIDRLNLYDEDDRVRGIGMELNHIPGGPEVCSYAGDTSLTEAIHDSHLIVMTYRKARKPEFNREQTIAANAPSVQRLCRAIACQNTDAFFALATNPINSIVPFASSLLYKYGCYNPFKIFGVTHVDVARTRMYTANVLKINPYNVSVPVIGGHSDDTVIPIFSHMHPTNAILDPYTADTLTRLVRKSGSEVAYQKQGHESGTLAEAMSIYEFINLIADAINGNEVTLNCYSANPNFGTRFFSGPTKVGAYGIIDACRNNFSYSDFETYLLSLTTPNINRDVDMGEGYVHFLETIRNP